VFADGFEKWTGEGETGAAALEGEVDVYVLKTPLVGLEALGSVLGSLYPKDLEHDAVLLAVQDRANPLVRPGEVSRLSCTLHLFRKVLQPKRRSLDAPHCWPQP